MESLRLDRMIHCPKCLVAVKPFVCERVVQNGETVALDLKCPTPCGNLWRMSVSDLLAA